MREHCVRLPSCMLWCLALATLTQSPCACLVTDTEPVCVLLVDGKGDEREQREGGEGGGRFAGGQYVKDRWGWRGRGGGGRCQTVLNTHPVVKQLLPHSFWQGWCFPSSCQARVQRLSPSEHLLGVRCQVMRVKLCVEHCQKLWDYGLSFSCRLVRHGAELACCCGITAPLLLLLLLFISMIDPAARM